MDGRRARRVLGVASDAGPDEVRRAFRALALRTHPDHGGTTSAFAEAKTAFEVLRHAEPRRRIFPSFVGVDVYDSTRPAPRRDFADALRAAASRLG